MTYGSCLVNIPIEHHTRGEIECLATGGRAATRESSSWSKPSPLFEPARFLETLAADDVLLFCPRLSHHL